MIRVNRHSSN